MIQTLNEKLWNTRNNANYEGLFKLKVRIGGRPDKIHHIKVRIKLDAFDFQSYAHASLFEEMQNRWNIIAVLPYPLMKTLESDFLTTARIQHFQDDIENLLDEVKMILGG